MNLKTLKNNELLINTKELVSKERKITTEILNHLKEIETRSLHLELGYSSLFEYSVTELKYSESQAQRRISAMRLLKDLPEIATKLNDGTLNLTNLAKAQSFIYQSKKDNKPLNLNQKQDLIQKIENKSSKECEIELIKLSPEPVILKEKERILTEEYTELKLTIKKDLKDKLTKVKNLLSHKSPNATTAELLELMCDMVIKQKEPKQQESQRRAYSQRINVASNRYIPSAIKQEVYLRDKGCCSFKDHSTNKQCSSKRLLQYDHVKPMAFGGETTVENLRLLCFNHHKLMTQKVFGLNTNVFRVNTSEKTVEIKRRTF